MYTMICLVGPQGAGKSAAAEFIHFTYGALVVHPSKPICDMLRFTGQPVSRRNIQRAVVYLQRRFSKGILADMLLGSVNGYLGPLVVVDGIREFASLNRIRERVKDVVLVSIDAPVEQRFHRRKERDQYAGEATMSMDSFQKSHAHRYERDVPHLMAHAEYRVVNDKSHEAFYANIDNIMRDILYRKQRSRKAPER